MLFNDYVPGASQVAQWYRTLLPVQKPQETWVRSLGGEDSLGEEMATPTPMFLPGKSHGWRSLAGYSLWGRRESDMTEQAGLRTNVKLLLYYYLSGWLDKKSHGGTASLNAIEKAFVGRRILNVLIWNTPAIFSALFLGIRNCCFNSCYSCLAPSPTKTPCLVLFSAGERNCISLSWFSKFT